MTKSKRHSAANNNTRIVKQAMDVFWRALLLRFVAQYVHDAAKGQFQERARILRVTKMGS
eukprot:4668600-Amphidinium_carterae.1